MQTSSFLFLGAVALTASLGTVAACSSDSTAPASPTTTSAGNTVATTATTGIGGSTSTSTGTTGTTGTGGMGGTGGTAATTGTGGTTTSGGGGGAAPGCTGGQVALTVKDISLWCDVGVNGGAASLAGVQTVCVTPGMIPVTVTANAGFMLGDWHGTTGDTGAGDPGTVANGTSTAMVTVAAGTPACVWTCCPGVGLACPAMAEWASECP